MKKLMIAAVTAAVASGSFGAIVYDYKASVKHMYAKQVRVRDFGNTQRTVYQKQVKSASLKGFLVVDNLGVTSATYMADRGEAVVAPVVGAYARATIDHGQNRAFLVVQNPGATAPKGLNARLFRTAKILPANLEVNFIDQFKFDQNTGAPNAKTGTAEGNLYVGGEMVGPVRPKLDWLTAGITERGVLPAPAAAAAGIGMIQDYVWTSCGLFGEFNSPDFEGRNRAGIWWQGIQAAIDAGFEPGVSLTTLTGGATTPWAPAVRYYFHDTWMNGAGFGKFSRDAAEGWCCGFGGGDATKMLETLSGNLKGGLFLCTYQGLFHNAGAAWPWLNLVNTWEDQWFTPAAGGAIDGAATTYPWVAAQYTDGTTATDQDQIDLWQDGPFELNTTDCISGTWSIKRRKSNVPTATVFQNEIRALAANSNAAGAEASTGLLEFLQILKGCALNLNDNTIFTLTTSPTTVDASLQNEIFTRINSGATTRWQLPALTPAFAQYYGLANFN